MIVERNQSGVLLGQNYRLNKNINDNSKELSDYYLNSNISFNKRNFINNSFVIDRNDIDIKTMILIHLQRYDLKLQLITIIHRKI